MIYRICRISDLSDFELLNAERLLSDTQLEYLNGLCPKRRKQSLAVRALLLSLLKELDFEELFSDFSQTDGKPFISNRSDVFLSLSHSGEYLGCAVSENPIGIDIEKIKQYKDSVVKRVCNDAERLFLEKAPESEFFTLWTLKEAYVKASGNTSKPFCDISFVKDSELNFDEGQMLTGETDGYKWSLIEL